MIKVFTSEKSREKKFLCVLFFIYLVILLRLTVFRDSMFEHELFSGQIYWEFFRSYIPMVKNHVWDVFIYLFIGNIAWFIPYGFCLRALSNWKWSHIVLHGFCFSLLIETLQYILGTGVSEIDDLILNTLGVIIGISFYGFLSKYLPVLRTKEESNK